MIDIEELKRELRKEPTSSITDMVTLSWHHQLRGWQRSPEAMQEWQSLISAWLESHDRNDAAHLILLMVRYGLKEGRLPPNYDSETAERLCRAYMRSGEELALKRMMKAAGISDTRSTGLGAQVRLG